VGAICAALNRPDMRFVAIKSVEQQASRGLERSRDLLVKQRTQLMNCTRSLLAELGIIAAQGRRGFAELVARVNDGDAAIPPVLLTALLPLIRQIEGLHTTIARWRTASSPRHERTR
jgi:transposase